METNLGYSIVWCESCHRPVEVLLGGKEDIPENSSPYNDGTVLLDRVSDYERGRESTWNYSLLYQALRGSDYTCTQ